MKVSIIMGKIQKIAEKMPNAWNISDHLDGYILSFYELYLKGYN